MFNFLKHYIMKRFETVNFTAWTENLNDQINEIHASRRLSRSDKYKAFIELGLKKEDLRVLYNGLYYNPYAPFRVTTPKGHTYTFGVEMECFVARERICEETRKNGVRIAYECYNHTDNTAYYKFVTDSSVRGLDNAIECVSPILKGAKGFSSLKQACKSLNDAGARVNKSCGLHVHIGAKGMTGREIANVFQNYQMMEGVIDSFMAPSRRNNCYAASLRGLDFSTCETPGDVERACHFDRYFKVNAMSLRRHTTIEFRQHQGSTNYQKISMWIKFCTKLVEWSRTHALNAPISSVSEIEFLNNTEKAYFKGRIAQMSTSNE